MVGPPPKPLWKMEQEHERAKRPHILNWLANAPAHAQELGVEVGGRFASRLEQSQVREPHLGSAGRLRWDSLVKNSNDCSQHKKQDCCVETLIHTTCEEIEKQPKELNVKRNLINEKK